MDICSDSCLPDVRVWSMNKPSEYKAEITRYLECFGANVRRLRLAKTPSLSQERLAEITGLHRTEIGKIEQGKVEPHLTTLVILAHGLSVGLDELVTDLWIPKHRRPHPKTAEVA
jgi:transcriptional regulator with XRE-family HTH domain